MFVKQTGLEQAKEKPLNGDRKIERVPEGQQAPHRAEIWSDTVRFLLCVLLFYKIFVHQVSDTAHFFMYQTIYTFCSEYNTKTQIGTIKTDI